MKMKLVKRIAIMTSAGIGMIGCILVLLETFGIQCFSQMNKLAFIDGNVRLFGLIAALVLVFALAAVNAYVFLIAFRGEKAYKARMITLRGDKDDVVLIKQETLDELVKDVVGEPEGVSDISVNTKYQDMKLGVMLEMNVDITTDIKEATSKMQSEIRHQLEEVNGIDMSGVSILVTKIKVPALSEGMSMPWAARSEDALEQPAEEASEEKTESAAPEKEPETTAELNAEPEEADDDPFKADADIFVPVEKNGEDDDLFAPVSFPQDEDDTKEE